MMSSQRSVQLTSLLCLLALWEVFSRIFTPRWLPPVSEITAAGWELLGDGSLLVLGSTIRTLLVGLAITLVAAAVMAVVVASSDLIEDAVDPFVNAALATPTLALIPVFIMLWGFGDTTRIAAVVSFALFPVMVTWVEGIKGTPPDLLEMSRAFTASRTRQLRSVILPSAAPMVITGLRIGAVQGIKGAVSAEVIVGVIGIGRLLREAQFNLPRLWAIISILLILSIAVYVFLTALETRVSRRTSVG